MTAVADPAVSPGRTAPASPAQRRLWFLYQMQPQALAYQASASFDIRGPLDTEALVRAVHGLIERHEVLRTTFVPGADGEPLQVIGDVAGSPLPLTDLTVVPLEHREEEGRRWLVAQAQRPLALEREPPFRVALARLAPDRHLLTVACHHIAFDGWSWAVFCSDLRRLYLAAMTGRDANLPPLPLQYADFATQQQQQESSGEWQEQLRYWAGQLADAPGAVNLPLDRARPARRAHRGGKLQLEIPRPLADAARQLCGELRVTPFMTLLAAFQTLLHRCSADPTVVVGTPVAGRTDVSLEHLIGFFVGTVAIRADFTDRTTFRELLRATRTAVLQAMRRQDVPFDAVVRELGADRQRSLHPLFQTMFQLNDAAVSGLDLPGLTCVDVSQDRDTCAWDLHLCLEEHPDGAVRGWLAYASDIFDRDTVVRLADKFVTLLEFLVTAPDAPVSATRLVGEREWERILGWSQGAPEPVPDRRLHDYADRLASTSPRAVAVECDGVRVTFAELARRSNQLAHHLRARGIGPESVVGVLLEPGLDMVTAILAVHKAGGAFLGIDPHYPLPWVEHMLTDSAAALVVTTCDLAPRVGPVPNVCLDRIGDELAALPPTSVGGRVSDRNAAYIVYTGGSTGRPKGVLIEHRSITNHVVDTVRSAHLRAGDRCLQFMSYGFDGWLGELTEALSVGATLVIRSRDFDLSPSRFVSRCRDLRLTSMRLPTSYWNQLVDAGVAADLAGCPDLRRVSIGGAMAAPDRIRRWRREAGDRVQLVNRYGPSECAITCAVADLTGTEPGAAVPIGRPMVNTRMYVLDRTGQPAGIGEVGELYVAGPGLARGYLRRRDLTAASFLPDPFGPTVGGRLYRTGDLARWLPGGEVAILGRVDGQIKLRGYRIEPAGIEATLREYAAVREALVQLREDAAGNQRLVAYVVPNRPRHDRLATALDEFLRARVPEYMVPAAFVVLPELPRTPSGKLDRAALPPAPAGDEHGGDPIGPRDGIERQLGDLWKEILGLDSVDVREDFFRSGGHSLLAVRLVNRIEHSFGVALPVSALFPRATIERLAELVRVRTAPEASVVVRLREEPGGTQVVLMHPVGGEVTHYSALARAVAGPATVFGVRSPMLADGAIGFAKLESLAADYLRRLTAQGVRQPALYAGWSMGGRIALEVARQAHGSGAPPAPVLAVDTALVPPGSHPPDIDGDSLLRAFVDDVCRTTGIPRLAPGTQPREQFVALHTALRLAGQIGDEVSVDWIAARFRVFAVHTRLAYRYRPRPYPGRVVLFLAADREDRTATIEAWRAVAGGGLDVRVVAGDHYSILQHDEVASALSALAHSL
ncbi:non-ribosomal peptide synthetase [Micromonospora marina]|uniref:non-ribosomal peptide synthetase n=1 Tax=Micromonospora marina TaxID=307120 RepID=UPI003D75BEFB